MGKSITCHCCEKPATVHLTQIVENKVHKVDLCEECAQAKGVTNPEGFSMADFLPTFENGLANEGDLTCESCGLTHKDWKKEGRFGCASCYDAFKPVIDTMLEGMHAGKRHVGRMPDGFEVSAPDVPLDSPPEITEKDITALEQELTKAIEAEEYEEAAEIRDRISQLKELAAG